MYLNVLNKRVNLPNQRCNLNILLLVLTVRQVNLLIYDIQYYFLMYTTVPFLWAPLDDSAGKNLPANAGDTGSIPGLGRCPGEGSGNSLQYSSLGTPMDRRVWRGIVQWVTEELDTI